MASAYLTRTPSSASNRKTFTWSGWIKKSNTTDKQQIFGVEGGSDNTTWSRLLFLTSEKLSFEAYNDTIITNRLFRDASAWYHIVLAVDTTQSTASDRVKLYVNGVQETSFSEATYPSQNQNLGINNTVVHNIGRADGSNAFDGLMTHVNFVDGTALTPTSFGQSDSNGVWIPKPSPSVTYGTNGFFLKMDNSGNMGLDSGGGSNNFTTSGTITQAKDTPSNVFATWNSLIKTPHQLVYSNGNTTTASGGNSWYSTQSTLGVTSGKWYWECKGLGADSMIGVASPTIDMNQSLSISQTGTTFFYNQDGGEMRKDASNTTADYGTLSTSDILGIAFDMDNKTITYYKNGVAFITNYAISTAITDTAMLSMNMYGGSNVINTNFGNGYFGTTAVTSAGANASGNGIFEYDVPTGYTALSTEGLNS